MNNWKHYAGSILLAGLLLQGCSDAPKDETPETGTTTLDKFNASSSFLSDASVDKEKVTLELALKMNALDSSDAEMQVFVKQIMDQYSLTKQEALQAIAAAITGTETPVLSSSRSARRSFLSGITDKIKDALVDVMDSSLGNKITSAAFDVVLNSGTVTVVMLDYARQSDTIAQVMLDAIGADWSLVIKMAPMLRDEDPEFGEKFAALAYEYEPMGKFFFANINRTDGGVELGLMYDALTDAMLHSNDEEASNGKYADAPGGAISHSTTGYMGLLMERYAVDFFIDPSTGVATKYGNTNAFASLMMNTGAVIPENNASINHGDAMELTNEQFFYAMFVTPTSTDSFVTAMEAVKENNEATATMFMDNIFLGQGATQTDSIQGSYNIISIGTGMYEGIDAYGFGAYTNAFIGFAKLIPANRYIPYAEAFMDAGYMYTDWDSVDLWAEAKNAWNTYTTTKSPSYAGNRSAGKGLIDSTWLADSLMLLGNGYDNFSFTALYEAVMSDDNTLLDGLLIGLKDEGNKAYDTVIDGRKDGVLTYPTTIVNASALPDTVYGFHGLLELAIREDMVNTGGVADMPEAEAEFTLPPFSEITWNYAYTAASTGVSAYWTDVVDEQWLAQMSETDFVQYFYPADTNAYIPSWMMAIDWLKLPTNVSAATIANTDLNFDGGYLDIYVVSTNPDLIDDVNLPAAANPVKTITMVPVTMDEDSIIAVDENGQTVDGLYVYKVRVVSVEDTATVLAYLNGLVDAGLNLIGIDADNAAQTPAP